LRNPERAKEGQSYPTDSCFPIHGEDMNEYLSSISPMKEEDRMPLKASSKAIPYWRRREKGGSVGYLAAVGC
jgi:hypothetical protein